MRNQPPPRELSLGYDGRMTDVPRGSRTEDVRREPAYAGIPTFLHLPWIEGSEALAQSAPDVTVLGLPFDVAVTHRPGARFGPRAIRGASNLTHASLHHLGLGIEPMKWLRCVDVGDAACIPGDIQRSHDAIRDSLESIYQAVPDALPVLLGGDHSILFPTASVVSDRYNRRLGVIHFDAHADAADSSWGVSLSHGTPVRRLIEGGFVRGRNFVQVGLRGYWPPPDVMEWMRDQGIRSHTMYEIETRGFDTVLAQCIEEASDNCDYLYLSVDIDVLDPAFAPGTGTPEPGGLSSLELLRAVRQMAQTLPLVALDVVEVAPAYDPSGITAEAALRVCLEFLSGTAWKRREAALATAPP